jgi:hypothetical protein
MARAEPPDSGTDLQRSLGGSFLDPLAGGPLKPAAKEPWELAPLPTNPASPGLPHDDASAPPVLPKESSLRLPLAGPVYLFGQVQKGDDWMPLATSDKMIGDTGVACKLPSLAGAELMFRLGPEMTYDKAFKASDRSAVGVRPQWLRLDLQARWWLLGPVGLECQGTALPALADYEHDRLIQDIRAVIPFGKSGQFQLGAKHTWENVNESKPWNEGTQFYGGFKLGW